MRQLSPGARAGHPGFPRARAAGRVRRGFTMIELMIALVIAAVLLLIGMPQLAEYHGNSRLREGGAALQSELLFAQSEAIKRNRVVRVVVDGANVTVSEAQDPTAPTTLRQRVLPDAVSAGTRTVDFSPRGYPVDRSVTPPVDFTAASINLSMAGKTCSSSLRCPGIRVDAGGSVRLCADRLSSCP